MRPHKDVKDMVNAALQAPGTELEEHKGRYFRFLLNGRVISTVPSSGSFVAHELRSKLEKELVGAGVLKEDWMQHGGRKPKLRAGHGDQRPKGPSGQPYASNSKEISESHGTGGIIAAGARSRLHFNRQNGGPMPIEQVREILQNEKDTRPKRGGLIEMAEEAIETARYRNLPPPHKHRKGGPAPWDVDRVVVSLRDLLKNRWSVHPTTQQFWRAYAEELTDQLETFVDVVRMEERPAIAGRQTLAEELGPKREEERVEAALPQDTPPAGDSPGLRLIHAYRTGDQQAILSLAAAYGRVDIVQAYLLDDALAAAERIMDLAVELG